MDHRVLKKQAHHRQDFVVGCGLGFSALMLKLYVGNFEYLVGVDISSEKIRKKKFDTLIALEVLHGLSAGALIHIEGF
jgi:SAM-dependent methyltransferase